MPSYKDVLNKLNKDREKGFELRPYSEMTKDQRTTKFLSSGSPYLDYMIGKNGQGNGFRKGGMTFIVGSEGSGKSSIALNAARVCHQEGKAVVYVDGEGTTMKDDYVTRFGLIEDLLIPVRTNNLEEMLDALEALTMADDVGLVVIDSIPIFYSTVVELKNAEDNTIGVEAKRFNARMPIIQGHIMAKDIALIGLTYYKLNPGGIGDPRVLVRGEWQKYFSTLTLELLKGGPIIKDGNLSGHKIRTKIKKNKSGASDPKEEFELSLYYNGGFSEIYDKASILIEEEVIAKGASGWLTLPNEVKVQGIDKLVTFFEDNKGYLDELFKR